MHFPSRKWVHICLSYGAATKHWFLNTDAIYVQKRVQKILDRLCPGQYSAWIDDFRLEEGVRREIIIFQGALSVASVDLYIKED